jgi:DNA-binding transcriptional MerR regulator
MCIIYLFVNSKLFRECDSKENVGVTPRTLRYWRTQRLVPYVKIGKVVLYDQEKVLSVLNSFERKTKVEAI